MLTVIGFACAFSSVTAFVEPATATMQRARQKLDKPESC